MKAADTDLRLLWLIGGVSLESEYRDYGHFGQHVEEPVIHEEHDSSKRELECPQSRLGCHRRLTLIGD